MLDPRGTTRIDLREHILHEGRADAGRKRSVSESYGYIADKTGRVGSVDSGGRRCIVREVDNVCVEFRSHPPPEQVWAVLIPVHDGGSDSVPRLCPVRPLCVVSRVEV